MGPTLALISKKQSNLSKLRIYGELVLDFFQDLAIDERLSLNYGMLVNIS